MNIFAIIILSALILEFGLNLVADLLNIRHLDTDLPEEFSDTYDEETYKKAQQYTVATTRFGIITSVFNLAVVLLFWFLGGFNLLDQWVRSLQFAALWDGLIYLGILGVLRMLISLPFSIYSTFVIEERFGFNRMTAATFVTDMLKSLGLSIVLGGPLLAGILAFFMYGGSYAWLYAWGVVTAYTLFMQYIAPNWIMPIFNKFDPLEEGELREAIEQMARKANFPLQGVYVMDGSKRSSKSNAFFTGFGKNKRIALFDTLIEKHSIRELVAVLAHEIGHYKKNHIQTNMVLGILQTGVMFGLLSLFLESRALYEAFYVEQMSVYAGLLFFGLLYTPVDMILSFFMQLLSRKHEYEADAFAAQLIENPENMVQALKRLSKDNLSNLTPHPFYVTLNYSHPPVLKRIQEIRAFESASSQATAVN